MINELIQLVSITLFSMLGSYLILPRLIQLLKTRSAMDIPNDRSSHKVPTPTMGGLSFFVGLVFAVAFNPDVEIVMIATLIALSGVLGFWDDLKDLSPKFKFLGQAIIATGFYSLGFSIAPLIELLFGIDTPVYLDWILTVVFMLGLVNAFNLLDGVDGLLIGLSLIASVVFSIIFYAQGQLPYLFISLGISGVSLSFLLYNFQPAKIFMGDTGSLFIGTYISSAVLKVAEGGDTNFSMIAVSLVLLACIDMLRLFFGRYLILKKPFKADRNHMHHVLLKAGWTHKRIVLNVYLFQAFITFCAVCLPEDGSFLINALVLLFLCIGMYGILHIVLYRKRYTTWKKTLKMRNNLTKRNHLLKSYLE